MHSMELNKYVDPRVEDVDVDALHFEPEYVEREQKRVFDGFDRNTGKRLPILDAHGGLSRPIFCQDPEIWMVSVSPRVYGVPRKPFGIPGEDPVMVFILTIYSSQIAVIMDDIKWLENGDVIYVVGNIASIWDGYVTIETQSGDREYTSMFLTNCYAFGNTLRQEKVLAIMVKALSSYNHTMDGYLAWPDGSRVSQEDLDALTVYKEDGKIDYTASSEVSEKKIKDSNWQRIRNYYKVGNASVQFTPELTQKIKQGEFLR